MLVREVLKIKGERLISVAPEASLIDAVALMVDNDIGALVVLKAGEMAGMLTFREVLQALYGGKGAVHGATVQSVMVPNPASAKPEDTVDQMRTLMTEQHIRYLPIKEGGKLLGVLSFHDVAKAALKAASFENTLLKTYIKNWPEKV
ncbi:MAG: CBS domain-containing protein [Burkholderiales bacterium]